MRTKLLLIVFIISTFAFSANSNENTTKTQIENLQKENESLKKEIEIIKAKSESTSIMIDNVDSMYQNNFDRLAVLFTIIGAIVTFVLPHYLKKEQQKIIELKEKELNASNTKMINEILKDFNEKLSESEKKYKDELKKETENLHNTILEKTEELEQNLSNTNHSLLAKTNLFTSFYFREKDNYDHYISFKISYLYHNYKADNCDLIQLFKEFDSLIKEIKNKNITIFKKAYEMFEFFEEELTTTHLEISENDKKLFETFKNIVKVN
ncbi:coiled-coil domain-containing protein [Empedobacter brevis]